MEEQQQQQLIDLLDEEGEDNALEKSPGELAPMPQTNKIGLDIF